MLILLFGLPLETNSKIVSLEIFMIWGLLQDFSSMWRQLYILTGMNVNTTFTLKLAKWARAVLRIFYAHNTLILARLPLYLK